MYGLGHVAQEEGRRFLLDYYAYAGAHAERIAASMLVTVDAVRAAAAAFESAGLRRVAAVLRQSRSGPGGSARGSGASGSQLTSANDERSTLIWTSTIGTWAFGAVSVHGPAQGTMNHASDAVEVDQHPFNSAEVERLLSYRAAVRLVSTMTRGRTHGVLAEHQVTCVLCSLGCTVVPNPAPCPGPCSRWIRAGLRLLHNSSRAARRMKA